MRFYVAILSVRRSRPQASLNHFDKITDLSPRYFDFRIGLYKGPGPMKTGRVRCKGRLAAITFPRSGLRGLSFTCLRRQRTSSSATSTLETTSINTKIDMPLTLMKSCNVLSLTKERQLQLLTRRSLTNIAPNTTYAGGDL